MPTGVFVRTEAYRKKVSLAHKGKKLSEETKKEVFKMKRVLSIALCLMFLCSLAFGWSEGNSSDWKSYSVTNTLGTYKLTDVSTNIIPKGSAILGYQLIGKALPTENSENVCTIYDGGVSSSDEVIGEAECLKNTKDGDWYSKPKTLQKQIYIHQGPNTVVTIYFE